MFLWYPKRWHCDYKKPKWSIFQIGFEEDKILTSSPADFFKRHCFVPTGHVWLEGDNLQLDFGYYGLVPYELISGHIFFRFGLWVILDFYVTALMVTDFLMISKHLFFWFDHCLLFMWVYYCHWNHVFTNKLFAIQKKKGPATLENSLAVFLQLNKNLL